MTIENQPFEDVSPIKNCDFPASHVSFRGSIRDHVLHSNFSRYQLPQRLQGLPSYPAAFLLPDMWRNKWFTSYLDRCDSWEPLRLMKGVE